VSEGRDGGVRRPGRALLASVLTATLVSCARSASREVGAPGGIGDPRARESDERGDPAAYVVTTGESFEVRLPANPTTGFAWELSSPLDESVVRKVGAAYRPDESGKVGGGGTSIWTFAATGPGRATLVLLYRRPWEPEVAPAKVAVYSVAVN
jgi:predicted secreted protein